MKDLIKLPSFSVRTVAASLAVVAFWTSIAGLVLGHSPLEQTDASLSWLGIDASWPGRVSAWIDDRAEVTTAVAGLCVMGGAMTVLVIEPKLSLGNIPGAWTALASIAVLLQAGAGIIGVLGWVAGGVVLGVITARALGRSVPESLQAGASELFASAIAPVLLLGYFFVA